MAEIVLDKVSKRFPDGSLAVSEVDLTVADGEFVILVGPSGCGKSTTLNMVAGLEDITDGELRIDGERMNERAPRDRDIAMVFQSYALYPHLSVRENMAFPLRLAKADDKVVKQKVEEAAEILDLTAHLDRRPANLSGGQRQRVAMGRAIVRSPKAFLMDEPLSNLDAKLRGQMRTSVSSLQKRLATTTLYVTHDQTEAMTLGDRVVVLRGGHVQQIGTPQFLYEQPANLFVAGFIGSPSMNFVPATLGDGKVDTPIGEVPLSDRARRLVDSSGAPREVIMGIRPEHFEDSALVEAHKRARGVEFEVEVDVLEALGSEKYAHFHRQGEGPYSEELAELAADSGASDIPGTGTHVVTRLSPQTTAREGHTLRLWCDTEQVALFDPGTGRNLTYEETPADVPTAS